MRILAENGGGPPKERSLGLALGLAGALLLGLGFAGYRLAGPHAAAPSPRVTRAPPAAPAAPAAGVLAVSASVTGATVSLDGRPLGPAPQRAAGLLPGPHKVRVEKDGYPPFEQEVHVLPGRETRIEARLVAEPPRVRVDSDVSGASVFVDRKYGGVTPVEVRDLAPGPHRLNVSAEGYEMFADTFEVAGAPRDVMVRFKEVRLDESLDAVHKHGLGSCQGRLVATPAGLRYEASRKEDAFSVPLSGIDRLEVDYLKKNLRVALRGGRAYNFTERNGGADALLSFQKKVDACACASVVSQKSLGIRAPMHPGPLRCSSVAYQRYAPSSRLADRAPRRSRCSRHF